jgi:hypothetical protein
MDCAVWYLTDPAGFFPLIRMFRGSLVSEHSLGWLCVSYIYTSPHGSCSHVPVGICPERAQPGAAGHAAG